MKDETREVKIRLPFTDHEVQNVQAFNQKEKEKERERGTTIRDKRGEEQNNRTDESVQGGTEQWQRSCR